MKKIAMVMAVLIAGLACSKEKGGDHDGHQHDHGRAASGQHPHEVDGVNDPLVVNPAPLTLAEDQYMDRCMKLLAYGMIDLVNDPVYRPLIEAEVSRQFDGDDNSLFRDLNSAFSVNGHKLDVLMENSVGSHAPADVVADKSMIGGILDKISVGSDVLYPQVYIPFFDKNKNQPEVTHIAYFQAKDSIPGDTITDIKIISTSPVDIQEGFLVESEADQKLSIIISINESVDLSGEVRPVKHYDGSRGNRDDCGEYKWIEFYDYMKIKGLDHESWASGKLEIDALFFQADGCDVTWHYDKSLKKLDRFTASLSNPWDIHVEWSNNWTSCEQQMAAVYERDGWPAKWRDWNKPSTYCSSVAVQSYRSADPLYIEQEYFFTTYINHASIPWEGTYTIKSNNDAEIKVRGRWQ